VLDEGLGPARDAIGQRRPLDELHDQGVGGPAVLQAVDVRNVRVIERGEHVCLALEARQPLGILGEDVRQDFQRDVAVELGVAGAIDLAHAARADGGDDFIGAEARAGGKGQM
jgi:hypothetical protein